MKKKFLSFSLAFILLLNLLSVGVLAAEDTSPLDILAAVQSVVTEEESTLSAEEPAPVPEEEPIPEPEAEDPAPAPAEEIPAPAPEDGDRTAPEPGTEIFTAQYVAVNPLYADVIDIEDLCVSSEAPQLGSSGNTYSSIADAAAYMREQMKKRTADISLSVLVSQETDLDSLCHTIVTQAVAHTGAPTEGDYLIYHLEGYGASISAELCDSENYLVSCNYSMQYLTTAEQEAQVDTKIASILITQSLPRASEYGTILAIHDYLFDMVTYDCTYSQFSTYSALIGRSTVCQGFASAMYRLLLECGIDCRVVTGIGNNEAHAWNIIELDRIYYCSDATWENTNRQSKVDLTYFLAGSSTFHKDHSPGTDFDIFMDFSPDSPFWDSYPLSPTAYVPTEEDIANAEFPGSAGGDDSSDEDGGFGEDGGISIDGTFPDEHFRTFIKGVYDTSRDGFLSEAEIAAVTWIDITDMGTVETLEGIEIFPALEELRCGGNKLTELDVSKNPALKILWCDNNQLTTLDVSGATKLATLCCNNNSLTELKVNYLTELEALLCNNNELTELDVSHLSRLLELSCENNQLTELDVSHNPELLYFYCKYNLLTEIDVSKNTNITWFHCSNNQLTGLDVSHNTALEVLWCGNNNFTELDVSKNPALWVLSCDSLGLTALDISHNPELEELGCSDNKLTELDIGHLSKLWHLACHTNKLTELDLSHSPLLRDLDCGNNSFTSLDLRSTPLLLKLLEEAGPDADISWLTSQDSTCFLSADNTVNIITCDEDLADTDGSGETTTGDLVRLMKHITGTAEAASGTGDVNDDGEIDILDVIRLLRMLAG